jgi:hypothetical protein
LRSGPTAVVDEVFRAGDSGWEIGEEIDSMIVVRRLGATSRRSPG